MARSKGEAIFLFHVTTLTTSPGVGEVGGGQDQRVLASSAPQCPLFGPGRNRKQGLERCVGASCSHPPGVTEVLAGHPPPLGRASDPYNPWADSPCLVPVSASWQLSPETEVAQMWEKGEGVGRGPRDQDAGGGSQELGAQPGGSQRMMGRQD